MKKREEKKRRFKWIKVDDEEGMKRKGMEDERGAKTWSIFTVETFT